MCRPTCTTDKSTSTCNACPCNGGPVEHSPGQTRQHTPLTLRGLAQGYAVGHVTREQEIVAFCGNAIKQYFVEFGRKMIYDK